MHNSTSLSINSPEIQLAMISPELKAVLFTLSSVVLAGLVTFLLARRFPRFGNQLRTRVTTFSAMLFPPRREARLHKVICHHCNVGMGVYNPVYSTREGISYIEGTCNSCGTFISAEVR